MFHCLALGVTALRLLSHQPPMFTGNLMSSYETSPYSAGDQEMHAPIYRLKKSINQWIINQTEIKQTFTVDAPFQQVQKMYIRSLASQGITSTGTYIGLLSPQFSAAQRLSQSAIGTQNRPLLWVQQNPLPAYSEQLPETVFDIDGPEPIKEITLELISDAPISFGGEEGRFALWVVYFVSYT